MAGRHLAWQCIMRHVAATVWTPRRRVLGNLIPAIFWIPPAVLGLISIVKGGERMGTGLWELLAATILGWLAVNQFGYFENGRMKRQLLRILRVQNEEPADDAIFVGFASPKYSSMLDAHEDVGFFSINPDRVMFRSETRTLEILRSDVTGIRFRANVHSVVGLGRWVSIEAKSGEKSIRLLVEPREKRTMFGNRRVGSRLAVTLRTWLAQK